MRNLILAAILLSGCTAAQVANVQTANTKALAQVAIVNTAICKVDAAAQPVVVTLAVPVATAVLPGSAGLIAGAAAIDTSVVHPDIVKACAAVGGVAVAAQ